MFLSVSFDILLFFFPLLLINYTPLHVIYIIHGKPLNILIRWTEDHSNSIKTQGKIFLYTYENFIPYQWMLRCPAQMNTDTGPQWDIWGRCWRQALLSLSHLPPQCVVAWQHCVTAPSYLVLALSHNYPLAMPYYFYSTQAHMLEAFSGFSYST